MENNNIDCNGLSESAVDLTLLIKMVGRDQKILADQIRLFIRETPKDAKILKESADNLDIVQIERSSHKLKSSVRLFSHKDISNLIIHINDIGKGNELTPELIPLIEKFLSCFDKLLLELQEELNSF